MFRESSKINYLMHHFDKRTSLTIKLQNIARHLIKRQDLLKFMFSKKATKNYKIFTVDLTLTK